ncbi:MAG: dockerin type I repeat-containing protein [Oscillospiraceae bacterium]|nr:dockerin type I repeat-containing protein [Oscillospiraceae bacterium]
MKKTIKKIMSAAMAVALMGAVSGGLSQKVDAAVHFYSGYTVVEYETGMGLYSTQNLNVAIQVCKDQGLGYAVIQTFNGSSTEVVKFKVGDVTMDGRTNICDLSRFKQYILKDITFNAEQASRGDINNDGYTDLADYALLSQYIPNHFD